MNKFTPPRALYPPTLGAMFTDEGSCRFVVWAPKVTQLELVLLGGQERALKMEPREAGYYELIVHDLAPGSRYLYRLDGAVDLPDPASRFQPDGVHGPSGVVHPGAFRWDDAHWRGVSPHDLILSEVHTGAYSKEGTFQGIIPHLEGLAELGITGIELMPIAQFPGERNWGYDGAFPFAPQNSYGGPDGLRHLVNAAHQAGLAVFLDVVYNHFGPEGNVVNRYGHYFTDHYKTPWGNALNFDEPYSGEVRRYFIENALHWIDEYHIDGLRLDAVQSIHSFAVPGFLDELVDAVKVEGERLNRRVYVIAESSLNDPRLMAPREAGGFNMDGQWCDDFHHALRTTLCGPQKGYLADYHGFPDLLKSYRDGYVLDGRYSVGRKRRHGVSAHSVSPRKMFVYAQNHDQVGNRMLGERLNELLPLESIKLSSAAVILSPYQPILFMGEEYGETARFPYFVSHTDADLVAAVRAGRKEEFSAFEWDQDPPDPQAESTFLTAKLRHELKDEKPHRMLLDYHGQLIRLRRTEPSLAFAGREGMQSESWEGLPILLCRRHVGEYESILFLNFGDGEVTVSVEAEPGEWKRPLDSAEEQWGGPGSRVPPDLRSEGSLNVSLQPQSAVLLTRSPRYGDPWTR